MMKFKAHQSFFIRKGWLSKGLNAIQRDPAIFMPSKSKEAMDELGLGSNQVMALRYWLQAIRLIERGRQNRVHAITALGRLIMENDPYMEEIGTTWALHCNLANASDEATSWYFFFNEFKMTVFSKDDFTASLSAFIASRGEKTRVALSSLEADFNCILSTYIPHDRAGTRMTSPESVIDSPLGDLGLVGMENRFLKTYRKRAANPTSLPPLLVLYAIYAMRESGSPSQSQEMRLESLLNGLGSPGNVFNLDSVALLTKLYELENDGFLRLNRTAGLDVVRLMDSDMTREDCLAKYYEVIQ